MAVTLAVDQMTTDTQELYLKSVVDQVHDRIPLIYKLRRMRKVMTVGGRNIVKGLRYGKNTETQNYGTGEPMGSGTSTKRTAAKFPWRKTQTPMKYTCDDEIENQGENQIIDTISEEVDSAQLDMLDALSENFFGIYNGTLSTPGPKDPMSINAALTHNTTYGGVLVYGGITRSAQADWFNGRTGNDGAQAVTTAVEVSFHQWDYMVDKCLQKRGNRNQLLAICGSKIYRKWKSLVRMKGDDVDYSGDLAKAGFASFKIDNVEIVLDDNCSENYFYMLSLGDWEWRINPKRNFRVTPFKWQGENNDGLDEYLARILLAHNLVCWKPINSYMTSAMA